MMELPTAAELPQSPWEPGSCDKRGLEKAGHCRWACEGLLVPVPAPCVPHTRRV